MKWHGVATVNKVKPFTVQNFKFSLPRCFCFKCEKIASFINCGEFNHGEKKIKNILPHRCGPGAGLVAWCGPGAGLVRAWWPGGLVAWLAGFLGAVRPAARPANNAAKNRQRTA
jgi:hypothetical protein